MEHLVIEDSAVVWKGNQIGNVYDGIVVTLWVTDEDFANAEFLPSEKEDVLVNVQEIAAYLEKNGYDVEVQRD